MIQVNNLQKKYNGTTVLNIENLEILKDKVWVLWEITVPVKQPFSFRFNPTFKQSIQQWYFSKR
jgi:hypothetical protein